MASDKVSSGDSSVVKYRQQNKELMSSLKSALVQIEQLHKSYEKTLLFKQLYQKCMTENLKLNERNLHLIEKNMRLTEVIATMTTRPRSDVAIQTVRLKIKNEATDCSDLTSHKDQSVETIPVCLKSQETDCFGLVFDARPAQVHVSTDCQGLVSYLHKQTSTAKWKSFNSKAKGTSTKDLCELVSRGSDAIPVAKCSKTTDCKGLIYLRSCSTDTRDILSTATLGTNTECKKTRNRKLDTRDLMLLVDAYSDTQDLKNVTCSGSDPIRFSSMATGEVDLNPFGLRDVVDTEDYSQVETVDTACDAIELPLDSTEASTDTADLVQVSVETAETASDPIQTVHTSDKGTDAFLQAERKEVGVTETGCDPITFRDFTICTTSTESRIEDIQSKLPFTDYVHSEKVIIEAINSLYDFYHDKNSSKHSDVTEGSVDESANSDYLDNGKSTEELPNMPDDYKEESLNEHNIFAQDSLEDIPEEEEEEQLIDAARSDWIPLQMFEESDGKVENATNSSTRSSFSDYSQLTTETTETIKSLVSSYRSVTLVPNMSSSGDCQSEDEVIHGPTVTCSESTGFVAMGDSQLVGNADSISLVDFDLETKYFDIVPTKFDSQSSYSNSVDLSSLELSSSDDQQSLDFMPKPSDDQQSLDFMPKPSDDQQSLEFILKPTDDQQSVDFMPKPTVDHQSLDFMPKPTDDQQSVDFMPKQSKNIIAKARKIFSRNNSRGESPPNSKSSTGKSKNSLSKTSTSKPVGSASLKQEKLTPYANKTLDFMKRKTGIETISSESTKPQVKTRSLKTATKSQIPKVVNFGRNRQVPEHNCQKNHIVKTKVEFTPKKKSFTSEPHLHSSAVKRTSTMPGSEPHLHSSAMKRTSTRPHSCGNLNKNNSAKVFDDDDKEEEGTIGYNDDTNETISVQPGHLVGTAPVNQPLGVQIPQLSVQPSTMPYPPLNFGNPFQPLPYGAPIPPGFPVPNGMNQMPLFPGVPFPGHQIQNVPNGLPNYTKTVNTSAASYSNKPKQNKPLYYNGKLVCYSNKLKPAAEIPTVSYPNIYQQIPYDN